MATSNRPPLSPSRSPTGRLPSPPPIAEDQSAPQSPHATGIQDPHALQTTQVDVQAASRRIRPGSKAIDMAEGPPLVELSDIDSPFQLTEHLKSLHYSYTHPSSSDFIAPLTKQLAAELAQPPPSIDRILWLYELCRFLVQKVNIVIVGLFSDNPACSAQTCPEMRASEWQYLCAVHDPPKACCAIDYCCHTLDWAANTLTSPKHFPSRLSLGTDNATPQPQLRQLTNIFRRVYRIFAHAWFSHRDMFWKMEGRTGLYFFFKTVCDNYNLIPEDNYTIPPEAEGKEPVSPDRTKQSSPSQIPLLPPSILKRPDLQPDNLTADPSNDPQNPAALGPAATARRHRHSPSKGVPVGTVMEENEEGPAEDEQNKDSQFGTSARQLVEDDNKPLPALTRADTKILASSPLPLTALSTAPTPITTSTTLISSPSDLEQLSTPIPLQPSSHADPEAVIVPSDNSEVDFDSTQASTTTTNTVPLITQLATDSSSSKISPSIAIPASISSSQPSGIEPVTSGAKSYAGFSPASPKASTFEELELAGGQQQQTTAPDAPAESESTQQNTKTED